MRKKYLIILILTINWIKADPDAENTTNVITSAEESCIFANGCHEQAGVRTFAPEEEEEESRIVGGQEAWAHSWPWQVSLQYSDMPACGGAIVDQRWVISASHCFKRYKKAFMWNAVVGIHDLENVNESCHRTVQVEKIISHKDYNQKTNENDIALLKLQSPLVFSECVRPVGIFSHDLLPLESCTVTGWGAIRENGPRASKLQEVNVTVFEQQTCDSFYAGKMFKFMMCAGAEAGRMDACQGDSGGPLSCFTGERYKLAGVVSWGVGCGRARRPGVYTALYHYKQWIESSIHGEDVSEVSGADSSGSALCGQAKMEPCQLPGGLAQLVSSEDGRFKVENVSEACPNAWPWQASLQSHDTHYCSGVLIHPRWVLAPRHCLVKDGDAVILGAHDLNFMSAQTVAVESVQSLAYNGSFPPVHDLSMIRLSVPARIGPMIFPVCITDKDDEMVNEDASCVTTGWGPRKANMDLHANILHMARVNPLSEKTCKAGWGDSVSMKSLLCTDAAASTSCLGDSGAPLVCAKNGVYYLVGLTTWGGKKCEPQKPAVFTRVSAYHLWIQTCIKNA